MADLKHDECKKLTCRAQDITNLQRYIERISEFEVLFKPWLEKYIKTTETNYSEKMIYLWVTINAWASIVVPDKTINHVDSYLIHAMAKDIGLNSRFDMLMENDNEFLSNVKELLSLAPVFQVLWLRNNSVSSWDPDAMTRIDYVRMGFDKNPYTLKRKGDETIAHYSPRCAKYHIKNGEDIPIDWVHTLHTIYMIRCNLFHGGKNYSSERDRRFIELAYKILWDMFEPEFKQLNLIDTVKDKDLSWKKLYIESGFYFEMLDNAYDFNRENPQNITYLKKILGHLGISDHFSDKSNVFMPSTKRFSQEQWISAVEKLHTVAEGGPSGMKQIELKIMDTYMAGLVRWLNCIGLAKAYSCDGHDRAMPAISFAHSGDQQLFGNILNILSAGVRMSRSHVNRYTIFLYKVMSNNRNVIDRSHLLSLAENLYKNKDDLRDLVTATRRIKTRSGDHECVSNSMMVV